MALLVERLWGPALTRRVQQGVEYFPALPFQNVAVSATA